MISKELQKALNDQVNAELWSAYLYLSMSLDAESKALKGVANWFFVQWLEEQDHARIFENFMNDRGIKVVLSPIQAVETQWKDILQMFEDTLKHEMEVTKMIGNLVKMAFRENDFALLSRLQWFVDEQVEEEKSAKDILDQVERFDGEYLLTRDLDAELSQRSYHKASPLE